MEYGFGYIKIRSPYSPIFYLLHGDSRCFVGVCSWCIGAYAAFRLESVVFKSWVAGTKVSYRLNFNLPLIEP